MKVFVYICFNISFILKLYPEFCFRFNWVFLEHLDTVCETYSFDLLSGNYQIICCRINYGVCFFLLLFGSTNNWWLCLGFDSWHSHNGLLNKILALFLFILNMLSYISLSYRWLHKLHCMNYNPLVYWFSITFCLFWHSFLL